MIIEACIIGICIIVAGGLISSKLEVLAFTLSNIWDDFWDDYASDVEEPEKKA